MEKMTYPTSTDQDDADNEAAIETLAKHLKECNRHGGVGASRDGGDGSSLTFTDISDGPFLPQRILEISTKRSKREAAKRVRLTLYHKERTTNDGVLRMMQELQDSTKHLLQNRLIPCLKSHGDIRTLHFVFINDGLPDFINMIGACFVEKNQPLKKIIFESCGLLVDRVSESNPDDASNFFFDATILRQLCLLSEEFHVDYESFMTKPLDNALLLSVLSQVDSLRTISLSFTLCTDASLIVNILTSSNSKSSLQELVLYNAFSGITKAALQPLVDAMTQHETLKKFTFLRSRMTSRIYRWAITTILEGNKNIIGLCTDGNYAENAMVGIWDQTHN